MKSMLNLNSDKIILLQVVFLVSLFNLCCLSSDCIDESNNKFKVVTIDQYLFKEYFLINLLDNNNNHFYLLSKKIPNKDSLITNIKETLRANNCYTLKLEQYNDKKYVKGGAVIDEVFMNNVLFWKNDTIVYPYFISRDVKDLFIISNNLK